MRQYIIQCALHAQGDYKKTRKLIESKVYLKPLKVTCKVVVIGDEDYPQGLYDLEEPPFVLFYKGNLDLLNNYECASVIGSRLPSQYALEACELLVKVLRTRQTIVSGLAKGIDTCAHTFSLDFRSVAVLGCGIDVYYPRENKDMQIILGQDHCIISEFPPGCLPLKHHFPIRNRIIAALSHDLYVMAAQHRSGTMKTVEEAMKINRNVHCLPHSIFEDSGAGCNALIADGAGLITQYDILK